MKWLNKVSTWFCYLPTLLWSFINTKLGRVFFGALITATVTLTLTYFFSQGPTDVEIQALEKFVTNTSFLLQV
jgi:hypothetical protein